MPTLIPEMDKSNKQQTADLIEAIINIGPYGASLPR